MNRRNFILKTSGLSLSPMLNDLTDIRLPQQQDNLLEDEVYWTKIRSQFFLDENYLDLRSNSASSIPKGTMKKFSADYQHIQALPSYRNSEVNETAIEKIRLKIAGEINCSGKEIAIMRNTTEALNNAIMGIPFSKGDEVVASVHEYDSMMGSLYQRQVKDGIVIKKIDIPYRFSDTSEVLELWKKAITPKTKAFLISHIVWISGQVYPVKEICELARKHNIITIVDAAQSFSHIKIDVRNWGCDYLGTSLHKWCAAPLGTGFLYIKQDLIPQTFPLFAHYIHKPDDDTIAKFENFGSATPVFNATLDSLKYWEDIGLEVKTKRMHFLKKYWTERLGNIPKIEIATNTDEKHSCGLAFFSVNGRSSTGIKNVLFNQYKIIVPAIENYKNHYVDYAGVNVIGVATPVYITTKQLDTFIKAIEGIV